MRWWELRVRVGGEASVVVEGEVAGLGQVAAGLKHIRLTHPKSDSAYAVKSHSLATSVAVVG